MHIAFCKKFIPSSSYLTAAWIYHINSPPEGPLSTSSDQPGAVSHDRQDKVGSHHCHHYLVPAGVLFSVLKSQVRHIKAITVLLQVKQCCLLFY